MPPRKPTMSQGTLTPLQVCLPCDIARQTATWQASAARGKWNCGTESHSATKNGAVQRAGSPVNCGSAVSFGPTDSSKTCSIDSVSVCPRGSESHPHKPKCSADFWLFFKLSP